MTANPQPSATTDPSYAAALDTAERLLGFRLERFQIAEVFLQVAVYAGVARAFDGYQVAAQVFAENPER